MKPIENNKDYQDYVNKKDVQNTVNKLLNCCDGIAPSGFGEINELSAKIITKECISQNKISSIHVAEHEQAQINSLPLPMIKA